MSKPEHLEEVLNSRQGHLNPFSLVNDKADKVKKVILDNKLKSFEYLGLHPLENDATIEIKQEELLKRVLNTTGKEFVYENLEDPEEQPKQQEETK